MPPRAASDTEGNAKWTDTKTLALLNGLIDKKTGSQSGNGWKPTVWPGLVDILQATFALYLFCEKYSGSGWDDEKKMCIATDDYIMDFIEKQGKKYACCFKKACPFYKQLDEIFDGLANRATGENVVHLGSKKKRRSRKENPPVAGPSSNANAPGSLDHNAPPRAPMTALDNMHEDDVGGGSQAGPYDDELTASPPKPRKRTRPDSDDEDATDSADPKGKRRRRHKSDSSSGSIARRNAEAGSQLARSVDGLSAAMEKPIITSNDVWYVDDVIEILNDATLLPPDPRGEAFNIVSTALTSSHPRARIFILAKDDIRRKAMIRSILQDAGFEVPDDY
ncbi:hypothetical protein B0H19DRAFT_1199132 [Mycena capillaripes]|nr:hypothetical protein B0H19DRAFT_1199132 [Mycena capillaripes]